MFGEIISTSTLEENPEKLNFAVISAGIACENHGNIISCENYGNISGESTTRLMLVFVGGICSISGANSGTEILISKCKVEAELYAKGGTIDGAELSQQEKNVVNAYVGGIAARSSSVVENNIMGTNLNSLAKIEECTFNGKITNNADIAFAGGIVGEAYYSTIKKSAAKVHIDNQKEGLDDCALYYTNLAGAIYSTDSSFYKENHYVQMVSSSSTSPKLYGRFYIPLYGAYQTFIYEDENQINNVFALTKVNSFDDIPAGVVL